MMPRQREYIHMYSIWPSSLGLPTDTSQSHVAGGLVDRPYPHPLGINYRPVNLLRLPTPNSCAGRQQVALRIDHR